MAEALYPEPELSLIDDDELTVLGPPPGPAGSSSVTVSDSERWSVDHADPANLSMLEVVGSDPARSRLLVAAFGGDGAMFCVDRAERVGPGGEDELELIDERRPAPLRYGVASGRFGTREAHRAGLEVVLADLAEHPSERPVVRMVAALELVAGMRGGGSAMGAVAPGPARRFAEVAEQQAAEVDPGELPGPWSEQATAVDQLLRSALPADADRGPALTDLASRLDAGSGLWAEALEDVNLMAQRSMEVDGSIDRLDRLSLVADAEALGAPPAPQEIRELEWTRVDSALVEVTAMRAAGPRWARVLDRGLVLLGQAPLRREGLVDTAEVVVPADLTDEDLVVQVVDEADLDRGARSPLDKVRAAVSAGRDAARAERLGRRPEARARWTRCAELWRDAADEVRADQAMTLAEQGTGRPNAGLLADELAEDEEWGSL